MAVPRDLHILRVGVRQAMVADPQLGPVRRIEEGRVPRAIVAIALYHKRYAVLDPVISRQEIPAGILDQPQHIIGNTAVEGRPSAEVKA